MSATEPRLVWIQHAPEPDDMHTAECGPYIFEISPSPEPGRGYLLQMLEPHPEDWPLVVWEMDGYSLDEAKDRAERLADQHFPVIRPEHKRLGPVESIVPLDPPQTCPICETRLMRVVQAAADGRRRAYVACECVVAKSDSPGADDDPLWQGVRNPDCTGWGDVVLHLMRTHPDRGFLPNAPKRYSWGAFNSVRLTYTPF